MRMIGDLKFAFDHGLNALQGPALGRVPGGSGAAFQQAQQVLLLLPRKLGRTSRRDACSSAAEATLVKLLGPLADRSATDAQLASNLGLGPPFGT